MIDISASLINGISISLTRTDSPQNETLLPDRVQDQTRNITSWAVSGLQLPGAAAAWRLLSSLGEKSSLGLVALVLQEEIEYSLFQF